MRNDTQEHQQVSRAAGRGVGLRLRALSKSFSGRTVLHDIDLDIEPGEFVAIVGRSGCGKSTLLRLVAQLDGASGGEVVYEHEGSGEPEIRIMFQDARLLPWKRVQANVALGLPRQAAPQALHALRQVAWTSAPASGRRCSLAASASAWPWRARWSTTRNCCCWTNRWARSMRSPASRCRP